jgi:two-component system sensor histidine kinase KdpD
MDDVQHSDAYVSMLFILAVFLVARVTQGYIYGLAASIYGVLTVNYFFTFPYFEFNFSLPGYPITILILVSVSMLTSMLTTRMKRQEQARTEAEKEKLRGDLLRAISHDFRTPLTAIIGANDTLSKNAAMLDERQKTELHQSIEEEAQWLRRIVENLLLVTRIPEGGETKLLKTPEAVEEIVAAAVEKFRTRFPALPASVSVPEEVLVCPMDALLIEQALLNLLQNAALHAAGATQVQVIVTREQKSARILVQDDGCGIKQDLPARFWRVREGGRGIVGDSSRASGIGLSVCDAIITAHGGSLRIANGASGGVCATILLPLEG